MSRFVFTPTAINGVYIIEPKPIKDSRGYYERYFCVEDFKEIGLAKPIVQVNHSKTFIKGCVRGFHYQDPPYAEVKIIRCIKGAILDVALDIRKNSPTFLKYVSVELNEDIRCIKGAILDVALDIRKNSPTFLKYVSVELNEDNNKYLYIPEGCAHAFQTLSEESELLYPVTAFYSPEHDRSINPLDKKVNVAWALDPIGLSEKDKNAALLDDDFKGVELL